MSELNKSFEKLNEIKKIFENNNESVLDLSSVERLRLSMKELKKNRETEINVFDVINYRNARKIKLNTVSTSLGSVKSSDLFIAQPTLRHNLLDYISVERLDSKTTVVNFVQSVTNRFMSPTAELTTKPLNTITLGVNNITAQKYAFRFIVSDEAFEWHDIEKYLLDFITLSFYETAHNNIQSYLSSFGALAGTPGFGSNVNQHVVASFISANLSRTQCRGKKNIIIYSSDVYNRYLNAQSTNGEFICSHNCDDSYIVISGDTLPSDRYIGFNPCHLFVMLLPQASAKVVEYKNPQYNNATSIEVSFYMSVFLVPSYITGLNAAYSGSYNTLRGQLV